MASTALPDYSAIPAPIGSPSRVLRQITIGNDQVVIPAWVRDLATFRQWTYQPDFPEKVRIDYIDGEIWVELEMEEILGHNLLKHEIGFVLTKLIREKDLGEYFPDGARLIHPSSGLACQPDATFAKWETIQSGRLQFQPREKPGYVELMGTPDMVLEIVSDSSVRKDDIENRATFARAEISEYWLFDVRRGQLRFDILRLIGGDYQLANEVNGWKRSELFGHEFRLNAIVNRLGMPKYQLDVR